MTFSQAEILARYMAESHASNAFKLPKYVRAAQVMQRMIDEGNWAPGDQLPPELEIVGMLEMSLGTVQKALSALAENGAIVRQHGRGTFVNRRRATQEDPLSFRFLAEDRRTRLAITARALDVGLVTRAGDSGEFFGEHKSFVRLRRMMTVAREFNILSEVYLPADRFGEIAAAQLASLNDVTIEQLLAERFGIYAQGAYQQIRCTALPERVTRELALPRGAVGVVWETFAFGPQKSPLSYQRAYVPPNSRILQASEMSIALPAD
jgi:GntR family transcriptional regulator